MGTLANGTVVAPFANAAMRLLREDWKGKYGSKMLSEELYPILQTGIPQPDQTFQNFITVNAGQDGKLLSLIDKFGNEIYKVDEFNGLQKVESPGYPPPKLKPRIVWAAHTIAAGGSISGTELDAVAVDPETGVEIPGAYVYTPPDGTTFASAGTATLYVNFTPTDGVKYRRAMGSTVLTITRLVPDINWSNPANITPGTALSGTQLNATATDPNTSAPVPGTFTYTPPSGTVLATGNGHSLSVHFLPDDIATYATPSDKVVYINVVQGTTVINWSNPSSISQGTPLSGTQLNATATVAGVGAIPGTFTYTPPSGTVLSTGDGQVLSVSFVPDDTVAYTTPADKTVTIDVTDSDPDIPVDDCLGVSIDTVNGPGGVPGTTVLTSSFTIAPATPHGPVTAQPDPGMTQWPNTPDAGVPIELYRTAGVWYYIFTL